MSLISFFYRKGEKSGFLNIFKIKAELFRKSSTPITAKQFSSTTAATQPANTGSSASA